MAADIRNYLISRKNLNESVDSVLKVSKKATITEVIEKKNNHINPVLVSFQNGNLNENYVSSFKVVLTPNENGKTSVEVETSYGHVFKNSNCNETSKQTHMIAIRNRRTNKIKLVEVDSAVLINTALLNITRVEENTSDYSKNLKTLNKSFGGKRTINRQEQRDKLNINSLLIADEVKEAISEVKVENTLSTSSVETESIVDLLPPCNRDTKELSEVYKIDDILSEAELESLEHEVAKIKNLSPNEYSPFFIFHHEEARKTKDNLDKRLAGLLFTEVLLKFLKIPSKKLNVKSKLLCDFSNTIHAKIINEFCVKTEHSVTRPLTIRDKSLCYIIALCLICCNYKINLKLLATSTAVHLTRLSRLARVVGAVPLSKDEHMFVLKVPLPALPKISKGKVQRK